MSCPHSTPTPTPPTSPPHTIATHCGGTTNTTTPEIIPYGAVFLIGALNTASQYSLIINFICCVHCYFSAAWINKNSVSGCAVKGKEQQGTRQKRSFYGHTISIFLQQKLSVVIQHCETHGSAAQTPAVGGKIVGNSTPQQNLYWKRMKICSILHIFPFLMRAAWGPGNAVTLLSHPGCLLLAKVVGRV
ncbi:hypothetical protein E2C01_013057 [Portunus trituberculatus]|uniref:Uncharacterized protein n=1 Tax=Portunus trituberculatus TaxID=210409 RepID=A0A5B7DGC0_PORTR|nr:hypothetical protein [Portunus trituberculatus]